ncbi:MAG: beta-ketoacyl-ACP synthase III [Candidatus Dormibacteria bacterium]|jgi:3-oxoacyl-[acyl-carrier-protein] synthase-3
MSTLAATVASTEVTARERRAGILSVAAHLPDGILSNADLEAMVDTSDTWITERTGIRLRHRVAGGETTSEMGVRAARRALQLAGSPTIDAIVVTTVTPDTRFPSTACLIQRALDLGGIPAFDLNAACSGFTYGLIVSEGMIRSGVADHILLVAAESMTTLVDWEDRSTCVLFGDGAGAAVLGAASEGGIVARRWGADGSKGHLIYYGPKPDDPGSPDRLRMAGRGTFRMAVDTFCDVTAGVCGDAGWDPASIDHYVPHQANQRIIEAAAKRMGIPMERVVVNIAETGNTSSASIPLALAGAAAQGRFKRGDRVVVAAFGAGATWGAVAWEWNAD